MSILWLINYISPYGDLRFVLQCDSQWQVHWVLKRAWSALLSWVYEVMKLDLQPHGQNEVTPRCVIGHQLNANLLTQPSHTCHNSTQVHSEDTVLLKRRSISVMHTVCHTMSPMGLFYAYAIAYHGIIWLMNYIIIRAPCRHGVQIYVIVSSCGILSHPGVLLYSVLYWASGPNLVYSLYGYVKLRQYLNNTSMINVCITPQGHSRPQFLTTLDLWRHCKTHPI
jgi:hypothetical protein